MNQKALLLGLSLAPCGMLGSSCAQRETPPANKGLLDTLPEIVANVNGEAITRQQVIERFQQSQRMMGHQGHTAQAAQAGQAPQAKNKPGQKTSSPHRGAEANGAAQPLDPIQERNLLRPITKRTG